MTIEKYEEYVNMYEYVKNLCTYIDRKIWSYAKFLSTHIPHPPWTMHQWGCWLKINLEVFFENLQLHDFTKNGNTKFRFDFSTKSNHLYLVRAALLD